MFKKDQPAYDQDGKRMICPFYHLDFYLFDVVYQREISRDENRTIVSTEKTNLCACPCCKTIFMKDLE